jgi:anti-sigma B factor antagonist
MTNNQLDLTVRQVKGRLSIIDVVGDITAFVEDQLQNAYLQATSFGIDSIVWNFSKLNFINSSGIGLLVVMLIRARKQNVRMGAYGLNEHFKRLFEMTRLNEVFNVFETEDDAISAFLGA